MHTRQLTDQRTSYIEGVTEEGLIGNLEAIKHKLGRNWLTDERREELFQTYVAKALCKNSSIKLPKRQKKTSTNTHVVL